MDDCLRCHGMHFEGGIQAVVDPVDRSGPWRLKDPALAGRPAIPCLACHSIHRDGEPLRKPRTDGSARGRRLCGRRWACSTAVRD